MKKFLSVMIGLALAMMAAAQDVHQDSTGNFVQIRPDSTTGKTFTDYNGEKHPVYKNKTGKLYIIRTSPTTKRKYRYYFKIENQ